MSSLVIDASFAVALVLPDEAKPSISMISLLEKGGAVVPALWPAEVANTLVVAERRKRITGPLLRRILADLSALPVAIDDLSALLSQQACVDLAVRYRLTVYDAYYLELALRLSLPLATLDADLRKAARAEGVAT